MRVLFVGAQNENQQHLTTTPELEALAQSHTVYPLSGSINRDQLFRVAGTWQPDVIHFALHSGADGIMLSDGLMKPDELSDVVKQSKAKIVVFNSCEASRLASYLVRHGALLCFYATVKINDSQAWRFALGLYRELANGHADDWIGAYASAESGDGTFSFTMNPDLAARAFKDIPLSLSNDPWHAFQIKRWHITLFVVFTMISTFLSLLSLFR